MNKYDLECCLCDNHMSLAWHGSGQLQARMRPQQFANFVEQYNSIARCQPFDPNCTVDPCEKSIQSEVIRDEDTGHILLNLIPICKYHNIDQYEILKKEQLFNI